MAARLAAKARSEALHRMAAVSHARPGAEAETRRDRRGGSRDLAGEPRASRRLPSRAHPAGKGLRALGRNRRAEGLGLVPPRRCARAAAFELRRDAYHLQWRRAAAVSTIAGDR